MLTERSTNRLFLDEVFMYTFDYLNAIIPRENDSRENHLMLHYTMCMLLVSIGCIRISHARTFATTSQTQLTDGRSSYMAIIWIASSDGIDQQHLARQCDRGQGTPCPCDVWGWSWSHARNDSTVVSLRPLIIRSIDDEVARSRILSWLDRSDPFPMDDHAHTYYPCL
jgi:hypothetical protein